ncbi:uncharacterized protein LOC122849558 [Aphidius gifuensis]|uniref:uncharacterized protein LOC122849558 n=1 Tax=Aphidius gifuensis TaxID=684658 RepID=UPI001CDC17FA|nr:uncharacterized protein LOC122849558 [Aphidius gifuensis]
MLGKYFFCVLILLSMMKIVISSSIATEAINVINIISNISAKAIANKNDTLRYQQLYSIWNTIDKFESNFYKRNNNMENILQIKQYVDTLHTTKIESIFSRIQFLHEMSERWSRLLKSKKRLDINLQTSEIISDGVEYPKSLVAQLHNTFFLRLNQGFLNKNYQSLQEETVFQCDMNITQQHDLYSLYNDIIFREIQVFAILAFSYTWRSMHVSFDYTDEMTVEMDESKNRIIEYTELFKYQMKSATNIIRRCDPLGKQEKGKTYEAFDKLFYAFVVNQKNLEPQDNVMCETSCNGFKNTKRFCELQGTDCSVNNHDYDDTCPGWMAHCVSTLSMEVCRKDPDDRSSTKLYHWIKDTHHGFNFGNTSRKCFSNEILEAKKLNWFNPWSSVCEICVCGCMDNRIHAKTNTIRAFSLLWSETSYNMVATGARLVARDRMFHIQLREGKLLPYGKIDKNTERWIPLPKFEYDDNFPAIAIYSNGTRYSLERTIDFAPIQTAYMDKICLQKLILNEGQLLSGARFNLDYLENDSPQRCVALDVKYGSFEYQYGNITASTNYTKQLPQPTELILNSPDDPLKFKRHPYDSEENKFISIQESDMVKDASQTTIPFFDLQNVATDPSVPLSGIELFHKGQVDGTSGGYISLKIYPLNLTVYMDP